jgi:fatty-acyl-CoA synthase
LSTTAGGRGYLNYGRALRLSAMKFSGHIALEFHGARYTFAELNQQVNAMAHALARNGVKTGDRVLVMSANSPDYLRLLFAAAKLGVACIPTSTALTYSDLSYVLQAARPALVVTSTTYLRTVRLALDDAAIDPAPAVVGLRADSAADSAQGAAEITFLDPGSCPATEPEVALPDDDDPAILLFTSGSTGTPKAVVKSFANLTWHAINRQLAEPRHEQARELFVLPITGVGFGNFILTDIIVGATCVLESTFDPVRAADLLRSAAIEYAFLAPTMMMAIRAAAADSSFPSVRVIETAYEISPRQRTWVAEMFPNARILYSYGCTEGSMGRAPADAFLSDPSCVGFASGLDEYRIAGPAAEHDGPQRLGSVEVAGPTVMQGYLTASGDLSDDVHDGWFDTGDLGWIDPRHRLHFGGRQKDMIKTGGMTVFAWDVENALSGHPDVSDVAVIGIPDDYWGEAVAAVLRPRDGACLDLTAIRQHAEATLAGFRRPKAYFVTKQLPLNATGKLAKGELRKLVLAGSIPRLGPATQTAGTA